MQPETSEGLKRGKRVRRKNQTLIKQKERLEATGKVRGKRRGEKRGRTSVRGRTSSFGGGGRGL